MKNFKILLVMLALFLPISKVFSQKGVGTNLPDRSSILELKSENRGLLIPRIELTTKTDASMIATGSPAHSLLVFNIGTAHLTDHNQLEAGFYYWIDEGNSTGYWEPFLTELNFQSKAGDGIFIDENGLINIDTRADSTSLNHTVGAHKVLVTIEEDGNTFTDWIDQKDLMMSGVQANNGLMVAYEKTDGSYTTNPNDVDLIPDAEPAVQLGGNLLRDTEISLVESNDSLVNYNLKIQTSGSDANLYLAGLTDVEEGKGANQILVTDANDAVRVVTKTISEVFNTTTDLFEIENTANFSTYSPFVQEVILIAETDDSSANDRVVALPKADSNNIGQMINIQIKHTPSTAHDRARYIVIKDDTDASATTLSEGYVDGKTWVFKSNGTEWILVSNY